MVNRVFVIIPAAAVTIAAVAIAFASTSTSQGNGIDIANEFSSEPAVKDSRLSLFNTGSPILGSLEAPLTMVEFGDYQCLNCNRYFHNTEHDILQNYVETGKLKVIFMDFAFIGPDSMVAAQAAHCAEEQGRYWEYHDELYRNWDGENTGWASKHNLKMFAANIELDQKGFNDCLDSGKFANKVKNNINIGRQLGVTGTPTFFIFKSEGNAQKIVGAQPYSTFSGVFDSLLKQ
ncbi:MAG: DsbA family protein [Nitrososphaerales archaeon]